IGQTTFELSDGRCDALDIGSELLTELGEPVSGGGPHYQLLPDPLLQYGKPPLDRGLARAERLTRGDRAAVARDREEIFEIVPIERQTFMQFRCSLPQLCGYRPPA